MLLRGRGLLGSGGPPRRRGLAGAGLGQRGAGPADLGKQPNASILLPTGRTFDAIDVPDSAGFLALARLHRMNRTVGPVTLSPDHRMLFFVLPGAGAKLEDLVRDLGWSPSALDLLARSEGQYVAAPPTRFGGRGSVQWAQAPTAANRWLPDVEELIDGLAYACGRDAAEARDRKSA